MWAENGGISLGLGAMTVIAIVFIHAASDVLNDYFDARNGTDDANTARIFPYTGGSRFIQNKVLSAAQTLWLGLWLRCAGIVLGLALFAATGPLLLVIGLLGVAMGSFYSSPPCLACRGLGDLASPMF